jgi:hypothetical protein
VSCAVESGALVITEVFVVRILTVVGICFT